MAAVASYYSHPTPASHSHQFSKSRGMRMCDSCGKVEEPGQRFRMCGACRITQYCSQDCQKRHWPSHKAICQHTSGMMATSSVPGGAAAAGGDESTAKSLRKFCSSYQELLNWSVFQALQLRRNPSNIRHHALHIELQLRNHPDPARRYVISSTRLVKRSEVESCDALVAEDIHRREERCRRAGGIGAAVILIQCGDGISQVMPVECDSPSRITWDARDDWQDILMRYVDAGRVDFKPITTTSKGVVYG